MKTSIQELISHKRINEQGEEVFTLDHRIPVSKRIRKNVKEGRVDDGRTENTK